MSDYWEGDIDAAYIQLSKRNFPAALFLRTEETNLIFYFFDRKDSDTYKLMFMMMKNILQASERKNYFHSVLLSFYNLGRKENLTDAGPPFLLVWLINSQIFSSENVEKCFVLGRRKQHQKFIWWKSFGVSVHTVIGK